MEPRRPARNCWTEYPVSTVGRTARAEALLQVKVLLARLGEVDRLGKIERLPFERKIEHLEEYLREAKEAPVP